MVESNEIDLDLLVIGGGISGIGIAWEAAERGLKATVVDRSTLSSATSANSMRIIHGGLRYLQTLDFPRMIESVLEQDFLLNTFPQHISPLSCLMPLAQRGLKSRRVVGWGVNLFHGISNLIGLDQSLQRARIISRTEAEQAIPDLVDFYTHGALYWQDAIVSDPAAFAREICTNAEKKGAEFIEHAEVREIVQQANGYATSIYLSGRLQTIKSRAVINASGPWIGVGPGPLRKTTYSEVRWCKAFNLVVRNRLSANFATAGHSREGRLYFITPRSSQSVIGTFYLPFSGSPEHVAVTAEELSLALSEINHTFPGYSVSEDDVESIDIGVLPMKKLSSRGPVLYGLEKLHSHSRYVEILSTKYTTFRSQARKALDLIGA